VVPLVNWPFVAPFVVTKTYVLVAKSLSLIVFFVVRRVVTTIEYLWQFGRHS